MDEAQKPDTVKASHILVKHAGSRNPVSRRTGQATTRTADEALAQLREIQKELKEDPSRFEEIAKDVSDCSSSKRGGDLGPFGRQAMQPAFENCAFHLAVNEISGIIETDSGFHIVLRTK